MKSMMLKQNRAELKSLFCLFTIIILFLGATTSLAAAEISGWELSPMNPEIGDTLIISGLASPEEEVEVSVSFEKTVPVYLGDYTYEFEKIEILNFNNFFTVRAEGVESLKVKMKMLLSKTESTWADEGIAAVSYSGVSPGEYRIIVDGIAEEGASTVNLKVTTVQKLNAGKDGKFSYRYSTASVPSGKLEIKVGDSTREIIFGATGNSATLQALSTSSQTQDSERPEERKTAELLTLSGEEPTDKELIDGENEEKNTIYLTENSWDENDSSGSTSGEVPPRKLSIEQEIQENKDHVINFFYILAGTIAGFGILLAVRRKK